MKSAKFAVALSAINLLLLVALLAHSFGPARAADDTSILRGRGLQIVDDQGASGRVSRFCQRRYRSVGDGVRFA
jgi:hypothetical protein